MSEYRIPPVIYGPEYSRAELAGRDVLDWGQLAHGLEDVWKDTEGEGEHIFVCDTGVPDHPDIGDIEHVANFTSSQTDKDRQGHATHVCGIARALRGSGPSIGVAPKAKLSAVKVLGDQGYGTSEGIARGIRFAIENGATHINLSLGGGYDRAVEQACIDAAQAGIFVWCAAGNSGAVPGRNTVGYPARLASTIAITSYNEDGRLSDYSSQGPEVEFTFPGEQVLSTWLDGRYRELSGTSMSSPFAAAVGALITASARKAGDPIRTNSELRDLMKANATDKGPTGHDKGWGWGVVRVGDAVDGGTIIPPPGDGEIDFGLLLELIVQFIRWLLRKASK